MVRVRSCDGVGQWNVVLGNAVQGKVLNMPSSPHDLKKKTKKHPLGSKMSSPQ